MPVCFVFPGSLEGRLAPSLLLSHSVDAPLLLDLQLISEDKEKWLLLLIFLISLHFRFLWHVSRMRWGFDLGKIRGTAPYLVLNKSFHSSSESSLTWSHSLYPWNEGSAHLSSSHARHVWPVRCTGFYLDWLQSKFNLFSDWWRWHKKR